MPSNTNRRIIRAGLESMVLQTRGVVDGLLATGEVGLSGLGIGGGAAKNSVS